MIDKAKAHLYELQKDGIWEATPTPPKSTNSNDADTGQFGGKTAMAVYALLEAGEKPTDPRMQKAIDFLYKANITGTYALALRCMVWLNMPETAQVKAAMRKDALALINALHDVKPDSARPSKIKLFAFDYSTTGTNFSLSRSQYGAQGLRAAAELNLEVPPNVWQNIESTWKYAQIEDGGWTYKFSVDAEHPTTICLTAAAIATLVNVQEFTMAGAFNDMRGNYHDPHLERGMKFLEKMWDTRAFQKDFSPREFPMPQLYAIERVGLATGLRQIGGHDWYAQGVTFLAGKQKKNGGFSVSHGEGDIPDTCFALLFLQRGRTPAAFNKLDYSSASTDPKKADFWNQRPRDAAKLTRFISRNIERELRWQIVTLDDTNDALLEAPILWMSGSEAISLKPEAKAKLKRYLDLGGIVVGLADGSSTKFTTSFQKLGAELFTTYEWRDLPATHPIFTNQYFKGDKTASKPAFKALGNGVREMMFLISSGDLTRTFQVGITTSKPEQWQFMSNLLAYSVCKTDFRARGESNLIVPKASQATRTLKVGHVIYSGQWNPEPATWEMAGRLALNELAMKVDVAAVKPTDSLEGIQLLYMTGTAEFQLDEASRTALRDFVEKGGTLLLDTAGGSDAFASSAQKELAAIFKSPVVSMPVSHPWLKDLKPDYRLFATKAGLETSHFNLSMIELSGRPAVIFSRGDLATGLIGFSHDGISGLSPASARAVMKRLLDSIAKK